MDGVDQLTETQRQQALLCLTTEHSALQSARSTTVSESNGRISLYLGTVSGTLIALGFISQGTTTAAGLARVGLVLFPALLFVGLATFVRVLQASIEDTLYARGINRIRHFYVELAPPIAEYFVLSSSDDNVSVLRDMGARPSRWQLVLTAPGMVAIINSVIAGVIVGVLIDQVNGLPGIISAGVGVAVFVASTVAHQRYQERARHRASQAVPVRFPGLPRV